jgi:hypothetical protein
MRKNLYKALKVPFLGILGLWACTFQVKAQVTGQGSKTTRQAKVKIVRAVDGQQYVLDTTFTLAEGQAVEQVIKKMQESNPEFKDLGFKLLESQRLSGTQGMKIVVLPSAATSDSLKGRIFKTITSDSLLIRRAGAQQFKAITISGEAIKELKGKEGTGEKRAITIYRTLAGDSLSHNAQVFRIDSAMNLRVDSLLLKNGIRIDKNGNNREIRVIKIKEGANVAHFQEGNFELIQPSIDGADQIIFLRKGNANLTGKKSKTLKAESKSDKKSAETISSLNLQFSPNPTSGAVQLSFNAQKKAKAQLRVVDSQGLTRYEEDLGLVQGTFSKQLNLSAYGPGVYVVQVVVGKVAQSGKIVVQ